MKEERKRIEVPIQIALGIQRYSTVIVDNEPWLVEGRHLSSSEPCFLDLVRGGMWSPAPAWDDAVFPDCPQCGAEMRPTREYHGFTSGDVSFSTANPHWLCPKCGKAILETGDFRVPRQPWASD